MPTQYSTLTVGEADRFAHNWTTYLTAGADMTANGSTWTVEPAGAGLLLTEHQQTSPTTSALVTATAAGSFRVTNRVVFDDGAIGFEDIVFSVPDVASAEASYMTANEAQERLWSRYAIQSVINTGDVAVASYELDSKKYRFLGDAYAELQVLGFPRSINLAGDVIGQVPERVLDWVALRARQVSRPSTPPAIKEQVDTLSVEYTHGKRDRVDVLMEDLLRPYVQRSAGARIV